MKAIRRRSALAWAAVALVPPGCVRRQVEGDTTTYATETWVIAVVALAALSACSAGWFVRRKRKWPGLILLGGGVLVLLTTVPGLSLSRTTVDPDHVEWNKGLTHYSFRFDDLDGIEHTIERVLVARSVQSVHHLDFTRKSGEKVHIQIDPHANRFLEDAIPEIIARAKGRGVPCVETDNR